MMEMLSKKQKIIVIAGIIAVVLIIFFYYINSTKSIYSYNDLEVENIENTAKYQIDDKEETIVIHITGAVKNPGVVKANESARINDIIELAGGLTENADINKVNLAYAVEDGQKIYIPFKGEGEDLERR